MEMFLNCVPVTCGYMHVCRCVRQERILINTGVPRIDLFRQMRRQDVGIAAEITITPAAAL